MNPLPQGSLSGNTICSGGTGQLTFTSSAGTGPFTLVISGVTYNNVVSGTPFNATPDPSVTTSYTLTSITTDVSSCARTSGIAGPSATITVNASPLAPTVTTPVTYCLNATAVPLTATGTGLLWYTTATGGTGSATAPTPSTATSGNTSYWVSQTNGSSCEGPRAEIVVIVNPLPTATISGTTSVCQNAAARLITFTGANGTAPYTFTYNINGGAPATITTTSGNSITLAAPTVTAGTFVYTLVSVHDASSTACSNTAGGTATITVIVVPATSVIYHQ